MLTVVEVISPKVPENVDGPAMALFGGVYVLLFSFWNQSSHIIRALDKFEKCRTSRNEDHGVDNYKGQAVCSGHVRPKS
jgi:hypothetical protein